MAVFATESGKIHSFQRTDEMEREIAFIPNETFEKTTEQDLVASEVDFYQTEDQPARSLDRNMLNASLLSTLEHCQLLTFEGEQHLFKRLNFLRFKANAIQMTLNSKRPAKKKLREIERLLAEVSDVREELARANLRLVVSIAGKLSLSRDEFDEFVAEGNGILMYAIDKFDYSRGYRFSTYLTHAVQRHLYRFIERRKKRAAREFAREPDLLSRELQVEGVSDEISDAEIKAATAVIISKIDAALDERESFIIRGRFGLDGTGDCKTYTILGEQLGLSKERVRQLYQRALEKLGEIARPFESIFAPG
jgi:RNA polymerase primary sigma factor